ncbi:MAG: hypothetical protein K0S58_2527 [Nitrospira sp.]|nr:hypothetical protein [Nitrospira sp.]
MMMNPELLFRRRNPLGIIHECRRESFETEARRGFSHVRPT